ncbi:MAG: IS1182 family transposase [Bacteroidales bacterium]|nr:IS1182 family transposase [Bacteroidales bacterium]
MGFIVADRSQQDLLGYSLDDFVSKDDKSRFIIKIISELNLNHLKARYSSQGGEAFPPDIMLALWFFAYTEGITTTRKLEKLCCYDLRFIFVSANLRPDHTTLSRFRKNNLDLMAEYFIQIVMLAHKAGISDFKEISIDGTKIKASCSRKQSFNDDQLARKIEAVRKDIAEYMRQCEISEDGELAETDLDAIRAEKERLEKLEKKLVKRRSQLKERSKELKPEHRKNHKINIVEPDGRLMPKSDGPSYNAQAAAESKTNFIVSNDVVTDPNDQNQFTNMHQKTEENIACDPERKYNADAGYHSTNQLEYIEEKKIDAVVAEPTPNNRSNRKSPTSVETILKENRRVERSDFTYHSEEDYYECPGGEKLKPSKSYKNGKRNIRIYQASKCNKCPLADLCLSKQNESGLRRIHRDQREILAENMNIKLQTDEAKTRLKTRATTIEPVFGNIKQNLGFRRFNLRGLLQVKGEFNMICIAHNLNILFNLAMRGHIPFFIFAQYLSYYQQILMSKIKCMLLIQILFKCLDTRAGIQVNRPEL